MNIQARNNINFGWHYKTHEHIVQTALKDFPQFQPYQDVFLSEVQKPDLDDIGFCANKHFYYAPESPNGTMSFFDTKDKSNNARSAYKTHVENIEEAIENDDKPSIMAQAARAIHFLQDMAQPQHTQKGSLLSKALDLKIHNDYESYTFKNQDTYRDEYFKSNPNTTPPHQSDSRTLGNLFEDTASDSQLGTQITRENQKNWTNIAQEQYNNAVNATKEFLTRLDFMMKNPPTETDYLI